ncbi:hypothetical protein RIU76_06710 [Latilactobacillus sakei subsp. sakei]|uniref:hypothetical protein n=1 Tax=Latilactobacillus sakei TaxID=1599 RepID=UPI00285FBBA0|nr:hypothetical protein [Latilactobacillus sakei]MDR7924415.1 hypothetical protein [Latilactobacillus sakei subsp. sakei]
MKKININVKADNREITPDNYKEIQKAFENINIDMEKLAKAAVLAISSAIDEINNSNIVIDKLYSKIATFSKAAKEYYPLLQAGMDSFSETEWTVGSEFDYDQIVDFAGMSPEEIDEKMMAYYSYNNYEELFSEIDSIIEQLPDGYSDQMKTIKDILKHNINSYSAVLPTLYALLDYSYTTAFGREETPQYAKGNIIQKDFEKFKQDEIIGIYQIIMLQTYKVLLDYFGYHTFNDGVDKTDFSRSSVVHGRYNPNRMTMKQFMQTVVILSSVQAIGE